MGLGLFFEHHFFLAVVFIALLAIWSVVWKGFALWRAAQRADKVWFIILLVINSLGILEIVYLFLVTKKDTGTEAVENQKI